MEWLIFWCGMVVGGVCGALFLSLLIASKRGEEDAFNGTKERKKGVMP